MTAMTASTALQVPPDGWTTDDLPDTDFSYEIVDGALLVTPPGTFGHNAVSNRLSHALAPLLPQGWECGVEHGLYLDARNYREPDVVVYSLADVAGDRLTPDAVRLIVEVMSPASVSTDRITKPAQYAQSGIPHYWRIELQPLTLTAHDLEGETYREVGRFTEQVLLSQPFPVRLDLRELAGPAR